MGERTAASARAALGDGADVRGADCGSAAALASRIIADSAPGAAPLLFLCAAGRRDELPTALHQAQVVKKRKEKEKEKEKKKKRNGERRKKRWEFFCSFFRQLGNISLAIIFFGSFSAN